MLEDDDRNSESVASAKHHMNVHEAADEQKTLQTSVSNGAAPNFLNIFAKLMSAATPNAIPVVGEHYASVVKHQNLAYTELQPHCSASELSPTVGLPQPTEAAVGQRQSASLPATRHERLPPPNACASQFPEESRLSQCTAAAASCSAST